MRCLLLQRDVELLKHLFICISLRSSTIQTQARIISRNEMSTTTCVASGWQLIVEVRGYCPCPTVPGIAPTAQPDHWFGSQQDLQDGTTAQADGGKAHDISRLIVNL
jgi:hypothetical protein